MKKRLLLIIVAAMMLSATACSRNTPDGIDSQKQESSESGSDGNNENSDEETASENGSDESAAEVDYDTTDMETYTDKDGNVYYYDFSCVPDWWDGKVEVVNDYGTMRLTCVIEVPYSVYLFNDTITDRVDCTEEDYRNGDFHCNSHLLKKYVPEGWEIDYSKSTSDYKYLYNKDLDVQVEIHLNGEYNKNMYLFDSHYDPLADESKIYWVTETDGNKEVVFEAPDYIDYTVQTYEEYAGYEGVRFPAPELKGGQFVFARKYPDGRVYYDCFWRSDIAGAMISITEEDAKKMDSAGIYTDIYNQLKMGFSSETELFDYARFANLYLGKEKYLNPDDDWYWKNRVR